MATRYLSLVLGVFLAVTPSTWAGPYVEVEVDGAATNNSLGTAEVIGLAAFTPNMNPNVFGTLPTASVSGRLGTADLDFYCFTAPAGPAYFDIDDVVNPALDTSLSLFNSSGVLLAWGDDIIGQADPGSFDMGGFSLDSFVGTYVLPAAGTYYLAVAPFGLVPTALDFNNFTNALTVPDGTNTTAGGFSPQMLPPADATFVGLIGSQEPGFDYTLHISVSEPPPPAVPEPGTVALLGLGLTGVAYRLRRRLR